MYIIECSNWLKAVFDSLQYIYMQKHVVFQLKYNWNLDHSFKPAERTLLMGKSSITNY